MRSTVYNVPFGVAPFKSVPIGAIPPVEISRRSSGDGEALKAAMIAKRRAERAELAAAAAPKPAAKAKPPKPAATKDDEIFAKAWPKDPTASTPPPVMPDLTGIDPKDAALFLKAFPKGVTE